MTPTEESSSPSAPASRPKIIVNGESRMLSENTSVAQLLEQLSASRYVAVEVNGEVVPRRQHAATLLRAGDQVELVTLVGGG
jgi:sulfur carrier protein